MKILVVEDDKSLSLAISIRLKSYGHSVDTSPDAISAMSKAVNFEPDAVLVDINLPGGDGFVVAERLANTSETSAVPVIFMTASKKEGLKRRAVKAGAIGFLEKPFSSDEMFEVLDTCH